MNQSHDAPERSLERAPNVAPHPPARPPEWAEGRALGGALERALDVTLASAALMLAAPTLAGAAVAILLDDGGPVLFRQERLGRGRRPFVIHKLRTMRDGRVTRVGRALRELGLDELPQLGDVLRGEMSLVGPRPLTVDDVIRLGWEGPRYDVRWTAKPGLTGPGQLRLRGACHGRVTFLYDRRYAEGARLSRYLGVLGASALVLVMGKERTRRTLGGLGGAGFGAAGSRSGRSGGPRGWFR